MFQPSVEESIPVPHELLYTTSVLRLSSPRGVCVRNHKEPEKTSVSLFARSGLLNSLIQCHRLKIALYNVTKSYKIL